MPHKRFLFLSFLSLFLVLLLLLMPEGAPCKADAGSAPQIVQKGMTLQSSGEICVVDYSYPQLAGLKDRKLQAKMNTMLKDFFYPGNLDEKEKEFMRLPRNRDKSSWTEIRDYSAEIIKGAILSVHYSSIGYLKAAAHPTKLYAALTIDLAKGGTITLKSLFRKGAPYRDRLSAAAKKEFREGIEPLEKWNEKDFFLTDDSLILFNLTDSYVSQGIHAPIKYSEMADILSPEGPLRSFAEPSKP
ncbi:MAG: hypothetical protein RDV48_18910 [Candidatus Eremiobacteraeota bacterium]|nr:hypothetical protein [Candidatus Eremiobacteraeota bacterium]